MSLHRKALAGASLLALAIPSVTGVAAASHPRVQHYRGGAGPSDAYKMSFDLVGGRVVKHFTFVSRCPGLANGTAVGHNMTVRRHRFSFHNAQFTITGRLLAGGYARGSERDRTGDCDSGTVTWAARDHN